MPPASLGQSETALTWPPTTLMLTTDAFEPLARRVMSQRAVKFNGSPSTIPKGVWATTKQIFVLVPDMKSENTTRPEGVVILPGLTELADHELTRYEVRKTERWTAVTLVVQQGGHFEALRYDTLRGEHGPVRDPLILSMSPLRRRIPGESDHYLLSSPCTLL